MTDIEPISVKNSKKDWIDETVNNLDCLLQSYEFTDKETDYVISEDLVEWCKDKGITMAKLGRDINKYVQKHSLTNVDKKVKKINGKSTRIWCGMKEI